MDSYVQIALYAMGVLALLVTLIAIMVIIMLGRSFNRQQQRDKPRPTDSGGPDPWTESARRLKADEDPEDEDDHWEDDDEPT
ncbi:MAG: hypothetical protein R3336_03150 [Phycisphaeraceae bacterium]|nr:hypothetical protein [Phycisphaeraceae bacterium]